MINFEIPKCKMFLTFSAIIKNNDHSGIDGIVKLQNEIKDKIVETDSLPKKIIYKKEDLYSEIKSGSSFIYKYPEERIHFSIVNYGSCLLNEICNFDDFERRKNNYQQSNDYKKQLQSMIDFRERFYRFFPCGADFKIKGIYLPKIIENSVALQAFPGDKNFFDKVSRIAIPEIILKNRDDPRDGKYFAVNIFRFINAKGKANIKREINSSGLDEYLKNEKENLRNSPIAIKIIPEIVISDNYLANKDFNDIKPKFA